MNGGHYTALSKVEEIVLHDVMKQRYNHTNTDSNSNSSNNHASDNSARSDGSGGAKNNAVCYDDVNTLVDNSHSGTKLSLQEFIATIATSTSTPGTTSVTSANGSIPSNATPINGTNTTKSNASAAPRWLKFDDEFVNVVPNANLHTNVVTGKTLYYAGCITL